MQSTLTNTRWRENFGQIRDRLSKGAAQLPQPSEDIVAQAKAENQEEVERAEELKMTDSGTGT